MTEKETLAANMNQIAHGVDSMLSVEWNDSLENFEVKSGYSKVFADRDAGNVLSYLEGVQEGMRLQNFYTHG